MPQYLSYYGTNTTGNLTGIIFAIYNIGSLPAIAIAGPMNDKYGRRVGMFVGCVFVIIGTCVQAPSKILELLWVVGFCWVSALRLSVSVPQHR